MVGGGGGTTGVLRGVGSNRCLDVPGLATANGTLLQIWDCNGGSNQQWNYAVQRRTPGVWQQVPRRAGLLHDAGHPGTDLGLQRWQQPAMERSTPTALSWGVGSGLCLDVTGNGTANGTAVEIWNCNGGSNQQWARS